MKRLLAVLLTFAMLLVCGLIPALADDELVDGKFATTRKITVEIFDRSNDGGSLPTDNVFTNFIKAKMLEYHNVEVEYIAVPRWTEVDQLNNLLASGDAPDVCVTYSYPTIQTYAEMGGVTDLDGYLTEYKDQLTNLWNLLGDYNIYYDKDPETGTVWAVEAILAERARINTFIRKDWLDKLELPLPTTEEEFKNALIAFRDNAELLLGEDAERMVPYATSYDIGWRNDHLFAAYIPDAATDEELYIHGYDDRHLLYPNYKEGVRTLNEWYNEGLVWKDFALYGSGDATEDNMMKAGFVGAFMHNWDYPFRNGADSIQSNLERNVGPEACYVAVTCFKNDAGVYRKFLSDTIDRKVFIPATCEEPLAAMLYLDFISSPEAIKYLQIGEEGINHEYTETGAIATIAATGEYIMNSDKNIDYTITVNGLQLFDDELTAASKALGYTPVNPDLVATALLASKVDGRTVAHFNVGTISAEEGTGTYLDEKRNTFLCQAVVAPVDQFDAVFDAGMEDYLVSGGQAIIDERAEKLAAIQ